MSLRKHYSEILRHLEEHDVIKRHARQLRLNGVIKYKRNVSNTIELKKQFPENNEDEIGQPIDQICINASEEIYNACIQLYYTQKIVRFHFSVLFSFTNLSGNYVTINWPGEMSLIDYVDYSKTRPNHIAFDRRKMEDDIASLLTYNALNTAESYGENGGGINEYIIGIHGILPSKGGCDTRQHTRWHTYENESGGTLTGKLISPQSKNNNCGIQCLLIFYKKYCSKDEELRLPVLPFTRSSEIRREMKWLEEGEALGERDMRFLGSYLSMEITVMNKNFSVAYVSNNKSVRHVTLMLMDDHYWLVDEPPKVKVSKRKFKKCEKCGVGRVTVRHKCIMMTRKRVRIQHETMEEHDQVETHALYEGVRKFDKHWLVYGPAGTGKSYIIRMLRQKLKNWGFEQNSVFLSTTGVSSLEIEGQTLNSYFYLGLMDSPPQKIINRILVSDYKYNELRKLKVVVIDEVSMLNVSVFYFLDRMLRVVKQCNESFGGIKFVLFGDFLQLPPIEIEGKFRYIFEMELWQMMQHEGLEVVNLKKGWRYPRISWFHLLRRIRDNSYTLDDIDQLRTRVMSKMNMREIIRRRGLFPTYIFGKKNKVRDHNKRCLMDIEGQRYIYTHMDDKNKKLEGKELKAFESECGQKTLIVKIGSQVMLTTNRYKSTYQIANGSVGVVKSCKEMSISVLFENGKEVNIEYQKVDNSKNLFMPLILSWAITSHKCQGKTLNCIITELSKKQIWSSSQAYVILSRCIRLENVFLTKFDVECMTVNPRAYSFTKWCEEWPRYKFWKRTDTANLLSNKLFTETNKIRDTTHSALIVQPKDSYKGLLYRNILFYDFETMDDEKNRKEVPYFNHIRHYQNGLLANEITICKICTPDVNVQKRSYDVMMTLVISSADKYNAEKVKNGHSRVRPLYICAYNGSGFDFHFIMQELIRNREHSERFHTMTTMKGTKVVYMSLWDREGQRVCMICHDMLNITCSTLKQAAKSFLGGEIEKEIFPHLWVTPETLKLASRHEAVGLLITDFPVSMRADVTQDDLLNFRFHEKLHQYGPNDVAILEGLYAKMEEISQDILNTSVLRFNTLSKMTWYGFLMNLENKFLGVTKRGFRKRRTLIYRMTREEDELCSRSIYGAKVYPRIMSYKSEDYKKPYNQIKDYYILLDIVSMYVKCMRDNDYPFGLHELFDEQSDEIKTLNNKLNNPVETWNPRLPQNKFFICEVDLECHPLEVEPPLGMKTAISGKGFKASYTLHWENTRRTGWYTSIDIYLCLRNKGKVHNIKRAFIWPYRGNIFCKWISKTFDGKKAAKKSGEKAKEKFYKTVGNGCYGSSLQRMFDEVIVHVKTYEELAHFHEGYEWLTTVNFEEVARNEHSMLIMKGRAHVNEKFEWTDRPRYLGSFVLAWSRLLYDDIYNLINPWRREGSARSINKQILYGDTDSFFVHCSALPRLMKILGGKCGMVGDDLNDKWKEQGFAKIVQFNGPGPKSYALRAILPDSLREKIVSDGEDNGLGQYKLNGINYIVSVSQVSREVVKIKGISRTGYKYVFNGNLYQTLTFDMIEAIINSDEKVTIIMEGRLMRNGINLTRKDKLQNTSVYNICRKDLKRTLFKTKFSRRHMANIHPFTVPHGYDLQKLSAIKVF
jgi:ATP-dependent DNA helicase PIF1